MFMCLLATMVVCVTNRSMLQYGSVLLYDGAGDCCDHASLRREITSMY